jgi:hypothetical protein
MSSGKKTGVGIVFAIALFFLAIGSADAQSTLVLQPDGAAGKDSLITSSAPTTNYGTNPELTINFGGGNNQGLIEFDLSSIPPGATITNATLEVLENTNCAANENSLELYLNTAAWDEATVTWNTAPTFGGLYATNSGETGGCDWLTWDVTSAVSDWYTGTSTNYGFRFSGPGQSNVVKYTWSSDYGTAASRPILRIEYLIATAEVPTVTEWGMIILSVLIALSAITILWRRRVTA